MTNEASADPILEGAVGIYRRVDLEAWGDTGKLISFDSDLKSLGFVFLGDLICSAMAHGIIRAYVDTGQQTRAILLVGVKNGALNVFGLFLESKFADGGVATTTTSRAVKNVPSDGIHRKICAWHGVHDLYREHEAHLQELKPLHGAMEPMGNTLLSVAQSIDAFSVRMNQ
jgi:hypothetical protein